MRKDRSKLKLTLALLLTLVMIPLSTVTYAADSDSDGVDDSTDIDDDGDNLIEIYTLAELNLVRQAPDGTSLNGDKTGCPSCNGYELMADLNFDTNGNGIADSGDTYWNAGAGWAPIGKNDPSIFRTRFNGNGHRLYNLYQNRTTTGEYGFGLFGVTTTGAHIYNLKLVNVDIRGYEKAGGVVGYSGSTLIEDVRVSGEVEVLNTEAGGIVGTANTGTVLRRTFSSVYAHGYIAGTIAGAANGATIEDSIAAGRVYAIYIPSPPYYFEGQFVGSLSNITVARSYGRGRDAALFGYISGTNTFTANYWDMQISNVISGAGGTPLFTRELKCPLLPNNENCKPGSTLFAGWSLDTWDFGSNTQYPELIVDGIVQRDSDGDFFMDEEDDLPNHAAASLDVDADGLPDAWNLNCQAACQTASGLTLDNDPTDAAPTIVLADPITVDEGTTLILDASASFDPDGSITLYEWELNGDDSFDDAGGSMVDMGLQPDQTSFDIALRVTDNNGGVSTATRTVTVVNVAPQTSLQLVEVKVNGSVEITLSATDVDADTLSSYDIVTPPAKGVLSGTGAMLTYTPNPNEDSTDSFTYTVSDEDGGTSAEQVVLISIYDGRPIKKTEKSLLGASGGVMIVLLMVSGLIRRRFVARA